MLPAAAYIFNIPRRGTPTSTRMRRAGDLLYPFPGARRCGRQRKADSFNEFLRCFMHHFLSYIPGSEAAKHVYAHGQIMQLRL